jgi:uncharacterized protein
MGDPNPSGGGRPCPLCGKPAVARHRPFCSPRCAMLDLGRWLDGDYRVATGEAPSDAPPEEET